MDLQLAGGAGLKAQQNKIYCQEQKKSVWGGVKKNLFKK